MRKMKYPETVEKWDVFEVSVPGVRSGNPFVERRIQGIFEGVNEKVSVDGFYDGDGIYKVRFMPSFEGRYAFTLYGNFDGDENDDASCEDRGGDFLVSAPAADNHGPVRAADTCHFAYEDGTPYYSIGTTCYVWELQSDEMIEQTLSSLKESAFNKLRFCILPKHYDYNLGEPRSYPYEGTPMDSSVLTKDNFAQYNGNPEGNHWDFTRFHPEYFRHIEKCILALRKLGIEADLIVMHPYDRWGFSCMTSEQDDLYWHYVVARFAAYRNVWWSLANEYDLMPQKELKDWERYARILCEKDPYRHLRSIHQCTAMYDYSRPWITHCSVQRVDLYKTAECVSELKERYRKPVVMDEIAYEGNIQYGWGNISGQEMTRRFWEAVCRGGYPGHGETYLENDDVLWWSHGGKLHGESWKRFGFLHRIMMETPGNGLCLCPDGEWDTVTAVPDSQKQKQMKVKDYYLIYFSFMRPSFREFHFDETTRFRVKVLDTWNMTVEDQGIHSGLNIPRCFATPVRS